MVAAQILPFMRAVAFERSQLVYIQRKCVIKELLSSTDFLDPKQSVFVVVYENVCVCLGI